MPLKSDVITLTKKHPELTHSADKKVISHVQRQQDDWILNTLMIEGCDIPFKFKRKKLYRKLQGSRVNLSYYPDEQVVAGMSFEVMNVVRVRVA